MENSDRRKVVIKCEQPDPLAHGAPHTPRHSFPVTEPLDSSSSLFSFLTPEGRSAVPAVRYRLLEFQRALQLQSFMAAATGEDVGRHHEVSNSSLASYPYYAT